MKATIDTTFTILEGIDQSADQRLKTSLAIRETTDYPFMADNIISKTMVLSNGNDVEIDIFDFIQAAKADVKFIHIVANKKIQSNLDIAEPRTFDVEFDSTVQFTTSQFSLVNVSDIVADEITISSIEALVDEKTVLTIIAGTLTEAVV